MSNAPYYEGREWEDLRVGYCANKECNLYDGSTVEMELWQGNDESVVGKWTCESCGKNNDTENPDFPE